MEFDPTLRYAVVFVIGITIVGFVDDNSFIHLMRYNLQIDELHSEINKYNAQHESLIPRSWTN